MTPRPRRPLQAPPAWDEDATTSRRGSRTLGVLLFLLVALAAAVVLVVAVRWFYVFAAVVLVAHLVVFGRRGRSS